MEKVLNFMNIPRSIVRYRKRKIIELHTGEKQKTEEKDYLIIWFFLLIFISVNIVLRNKQIALSSLGVFLCIVMTLKIIRKKSSWNLGTGTASLSKVMLKDEDGKNIKVWELNNKTSLLIGKKTKNNEVDIDLSSSVYASLISREHGILNYTGKKWYFEDIGSSNGSGLKRKKEEKKFKVDEGKSYPLMSGDTIYIANTKLILK